MSRKPIIAANWKMNVGPAEATTFINAFLNNIKGVNLSCDVVIVPPYITIPTATAALKGSIVGVGAQDVSTHDNGAFTGEISTAMLNEVGVTYIVLGHSERRQYHGETNALINEKVKKTIADGFTPIFCIGETKDERLGGKLEQVLKTQIVDGLKDLTPEQVAATVVAYEPVWAIGTGLTATSKEAQEAHAFIRKVIADTFNAETAAKVRIQYGGSVKPNNVVELMAQPDIDGALVGGAALLPDSFTSLVSFDK
ncbi:MAG: triose-phosphate isomerase [Akkermansia sp.]